MNLRSTLKMKHDLIDYEMVLHYLIHKFDEFKEDSSLLENKFFISFRQKEKEILTNTRLSKHDAQIIFKILSAVFGDSVKMYKASLDYGVSVSSVLF